MKEARRNFNGGGTTEDTEDTEDAKMSGNGKENTDSAYGVNAGNGGGIREDAEATA